MKRKSLPIVFVAISMLMGCGSKQQASNQDPPSVSPISQPSVASQPSVTSQPSVASQPSVHKQLAITLPSVATQPLVTYKHPVASVKSSTPSPSPSPIQGKFQPKPSVAPSPKTVIVARLKPEAVRTAKKGNCECPYDTDKAGKACGGRSAYLRKNGRKPRCYESDPK